MSRRTQRDTTSQVPTRAQSARRSTYDPAGAGLEPEPRRRGPHLGPIAITPLRVMLLVALVGGLAFLAYSVLVRDQLQVPLMATGFAICGLVFAAMAILSVISIVRAGHAGRDGTAVMTALFGGLIAVAAFGCIAAAVIFSLIWSGTKAT